MSNEKIIWDFLKEKDLNDYAVAGIMGNLKAESALNPKNLQGSYERKLGLSDETYTAAVDNGTYTNFVRDKAGYGLVQWTYWTRKQNLLEFAQKKGTSIGNLTMQLEFMWKELQSYKQVMNTLRSASSVFEASTAFMLNYEKPGNQSMSSQKNRAAYGQTYYDKYAAKPMVDDNDFAHFETTYRTHLVKQGDTLWKLSKLYLGSGLKWTRIAKLNGIHGTMIRIGQVLKIPEK